MISSRFRLITDTISVLVVNAYLVPIFILNIQDEITLWYFNYERSTQESRLWQNVILRGPPSTSFPVQSIAPSGIDDTSLNVSLTFVNSRISIYAAVYTDIRGFRRVTAVHQTVHQRASCGEDKRQWSENNSVAAFPCTRPYVCVSRLRTLKTP